MATTPIKQLTENGKDFIPVTHQKAVYDNDGNTLDYVLSGIKTQVGSMSSYVEQTEQNASNAENYANLSSQKADQAVQKANAIEALLNTIIASGTTDDAIAAQLALIRSEIAVIPKHEAVTLEQYLQMESDGTLSPNTYYNILED